MFVSNLPRADYLRAPHGKTIRLGGVLVCALLLGTLIAGCSVASRTSTATPTNTVASTATPAPPPPAPAGVYVLTLSYLQVLSLADGTLQHSYPYDNPGATVPGTDVSPPVIADGVVYFFVHVPDITLPVGYDLVMALRATDAHEIWRFKIPGESPEDRPIVDGGILYISVQGNPDTFYALSARDGHILWQAQEATIRAPAMVDNGVVYLPVQPQDGTQHILALRATDGTQMWDFPAPTCGIIGTPTLDNGMLYLTCGLLNGDAYGVRASDGKLVWHTGSLGLSIQDAEAAFGLVYLVAGGCGPIAYRTCPPLYLFALDEQTGAVRFRTQTCHSAAFVTDGVLYCGFGTVLDPATGAVRLVYSVPHVQRFEGSVTIVNGVIFFVGDEQVFAISPTQVLWHSPELVDPRISIFGLFVVPQA